MDNIIEDIAAKLSLLEKRVYKLEATKQKATSPTLQEVADYCKEKNSSVDPEQFWAHHETVGWVYGRQNRPIKSWKSCITTWELRQKAEAKKSNRQDLDKY